ATSAAVRAVTESDVPHESFAHINGPVQAVGADEVVIGGHTPLLLEAGALACTDPDEWLSELGKRKIDSL
ncbi:riboflavin biosynthesis protein RibD, partial [Bifidobacterium adolescentis]|nr:riboflavin biosynthesis protein RibD [Bifidobacterium adolescentis]